MRLGKQLNKPDAASLDSSIVIAAQIAFAALLLYMTNQPLDSDNSANAQVSIEPETPMDETLSDILDQTLSIDSLGTTDQGVSVVPAGFASENSSVAVAATNIEATVLEVRNKN